MGLRFALAKAVGSTLTWGLRTVARRPAGNMPGKIALYVDPQIIADLRPRLREGSIVVVGTNGKTSMTNLVADVFEAAGKTVACNRSGGNLDSGVATTLLQSKTVDWGVFESDELWLAKILPFLQSDYLLLLNLFPDQLDRVGETRNIQDSIVATLSKSPNTVLVYNADDPLCAAIALRVSNPTVPFGVAEDMHLPQSDTVEGEMCQQCESMLEYAYRQYSQLGAYACPSCSFARPALAFSASQVRMTPAEVTFVAQDERAGTSRTIRSGQSTPYTVYNLLGAYAAVTQAQVSAETFQRAVDAFNPRNGRLQRYQLGDRAALLNLAKNPAGFNQNIQIVARGEGVRAVAFFVNNREGDGRDVSWLWDVDFECLADQPDLVAFAGGMCKQEVQTRLKYAGIDAQLVENMADVIAAVSATEAVAGETALYAIANYTALPAVHAELDALAAQGGTVPAAGAGAGGNAQVATDLPEVMAEPVVAGDAGVAAGADSQASGQPLVIAHLLPDLMNLNGERGNVRMMEQQVRWSGRDVDVLRIDHGDPFVLADVDVAFLGHGTKRGQELARHDLVEARDELRAFVERGGVLFAVGSGSEMVREILADETLLERETVIAVPQQGAVLAQDEALFARVLNLIGRGRA